MTHNETDNPPIDPLTVGELISLQQAAEYAQLKKDSLPDYIKRGRLSSDSLTSASLPDCTRFAAHGHQRVELLPELPKLKWLEQKCIRTSLQY